MKKRYFIIIITIALNFFALLENILKFNNKTQPEDDFPYFALSQYYWKQNLLSYCEDNNITLDKETFLFFM